MYQMFETYQIHTLPHTVSENSKSKGLYIFHPMQLECFEQGALYA